MDLKRLQGFENLVPTQGTTGGLSKPSIGRSDEKGPSFKEALNGALGGTQGIQNPTLQKLNPSEGLKFSNHAVERMQTRGIRFSPEDMVKLNDAVNRAAMKGSKDSLILMKDSALIVSVKNKTVVTVMDKAALKENVFTNIDSTIVM